MYRFSIVERGGVPARYSLLVYAKEGDNYTASCQITMGESLVNGQAQRVGHIDSLHGKGFYEGLLSGGLEELKLLGTNTFLADMKAGHVRLIQTYLRDRVRLTAIGSEEVNGVALVKVQMVIDGDAPMMS